MNMIQKTMSEKIVQLNEEVIKGQLKELVRGSVEETLNELLEAEAEKLTQAARYERNERRQGYRSGHYSRNLTTTSGDVTLKVPKLKGISFETAIIERYRRRESSVEEALIEMYLAGYVNSFLTAHRFEDDFKDIEMSGRTGMDKGENIRLLMERNSVARAVYVGDTQGDETAARFAGIPFIHAAYGFGQAVRPDGIIYSIRELPELLGALGF